MKVYIVITNDRHADIDVEAYENKDVAITVAREIAKSYCRHEEDYEEREIADWVFHANYSCEGDYISVREKELI